MTRHLSVDEQVAVLDGALDPARMAHVDGCAACRGQLDELRATLAEVASADVPEPSPLFWDHFSNRVRRATQAEPEAGRVSAWFGWRSWVVLASAMAALVVTVAVRQPSVRVPVMSDIAVASGGAAGTTERVPAAQAANDEAGPWTAVVQMASSLSVEDVRGLMPAVSESSTLVEDLNPAERAAFVRLLTAEMGKSQ